VDPKAIDFFPKHYWMISKLHPCSLHLVTGNEIWKIVWHVLIAFFFLTKSKLLF